MSAIAWIVGSIIAILIIAAGIVAYIIYKRKSNTAPGPGGSPTGPGFALSPNGCPQFYTIAGKDIPQFNLPNMPISVSQADCQNNCSTTPGCDWYNYNSATGQCWLKTAKAAPGMNTGFAIPGADDSCPAWAQYSDVDIPYFDKVPKQQAATEADCQQLCTTNNCDWYNYDTTKTTCFIKQALATPNMQTTVRIPSS
jgi:hypothetical protein